ncbi:hypothetical protein [Ktedonospora formicarum]|uniref:Uncharacterized protein n=1 Tax=Ktedonospora formicarum TaxID=2778364 RepID=A0A8J3I9K6_9CHLR|nr:hypothetical protein [Ktedonospora formicarum]GHO47989.1 hypothetical protein KSX_61520 [Ktedonospora formicarum]
MAHTIKRGFITSFDKSTYTCSVYLIEAQTITLDNVPVALHVDATSMLNGAYCAVLFFDESNLSEAIVFASYTSPTSGSVPAYPPGRMAFIPKYKLQDGNISTGSATIQAGGINNIPARANAILCNIAISSTTATAQATFGPPGATTCSMVVQAASKELDMSCLVPLNSSGQLGVTVSATTYVLIYVYGYVM